MQIGRGRMRVRIVLNDGIRTCCSRYPTILIRKLAEEWLGDLCDVEVIDKTKEKWIPEGIDAMAIKYLHDSAFPLLYVDDVLIGIASFPDRDQFRELLEKRTYEEITEKDILEAAEKYGLTG